MKTKKCKILVIDKNKSNFNYFKKELAKISDTIYFACNSIESLKILDFKNPDLIVLNLSNIDKSLSGLEFGKLLKNNYKVNVIGYFPEKENIMPLLRAKQEGFDAIISFPFNSEEIKNILNNIGVTK